MVRNLKVQIYNFHAITVQLLVRHHAIQLLSSQTYQEASPDERAAYPRHAGGVKRKNSNILHCEKKVLY